MAAICTSKGPGGIQKYFEACVAHIVPYCPVSKNGAAGTNRDASETLEVNTDDKEAEIPSFESKSGKVPKTGVHLLYHKGPEYHRLSYE